MGGVVDLGSQPIRNVCGSTSMANYGANGATGFGVGVVASTVAAGTDGPMGGKSYRRATVATAFTPATGADLFSVNVGTFGLSAINMTFPAQVGQAFSIAVLVRSSIAQKVRLQAQAISPTAGGPGTKTGADVTLVPGVWTWLTLDNWVCLSGTVGCRIDVDAASVGPVGWTVGDTMDVGRAYAYAGATQPPGVPADGDTPGWRWIGAAQASESVGYPYTVESIAGQPAAVRTAAGTTAVTAGAFQGRTMYTVHDVIDTASNNANIARSGLSDSAGMVLRVSGPGQPNNYILVNLPGGLVNPLRNVAKRTVGRHVAACYLADGFTDALLTIDGSTGTSLPLTPGTGLTTADLTVPAPSASDSTIAAYVWLRAHSLETQLRISGWLARKYNAPMPAGY